MKYEPACVRGPIGIRQVFVLSTGNLIAAATGARGPAYLCIFDSEGKLVKEVPIYKGPLRSITLSGDEQFLAVCYCDGNKTIYSLPNFKKVKEKKDAHDMPATGVSFIGDATVVSGSGDYNINLLKYSKGGSSGAAS